VSPVQTILPQAIRCQVCGTEATATLFEVAMVGPEDPPCFQASWLRMPQGWWLLRGPDEIHCRCPSCLQAQRRGKS
jgi:hypothetical protein